MFKLRAGYLLKAEIYKVSERQEVQTDFLNTITQPPGPVPPTSRMNVKPGRLKPIIHVAVIESEPVRFVGLRALFTSRPAFDLIAATVDQVIVNQAIQVVLLAARERQNLLQRVAVLTSMRPEVKTIVMGTGLNDETVLKAIAHGAKGYLDDAAEPAHFVQAVRTVNEGLVWAPRPVLSKFIDLVSARENPGVSLRGVNFTDRQKDVIKELVLGRSNKEIGAALGITERSVKAHVSTLMNKTGASNRVELSTHPASLSLLALN